MAQRAQVTVTDETAARETRRHRTRAAQATDRSEVADLAARVATDPALEQSLSPGQRISLGLYQSALASCEWLRINDQTEETR